MDPKKLNSQDAFDLVARRQGEKGKKEQNKKKHQNIEDGFGETQEQSPKPLWKRYLLFILLTLLTCITVAGIFSFYWFISKHSEPEVIVKAPAEPGPAIIDEAQAKKMIEDQLRAFLNCTNTQDRLAYVLTPRMEHDHMIDYYDKRGNLDVALWKIKLIQSANLEGMQIWMAAYLDVKKNLHYMRFGRTGNQFAIQWSSSFAYGQLPWNTFARNQPKEPVQMRCYILRHSGTPPEGFDPLTHSSFVVENQRGEFTEVAVMRHDAEGARLLKQIPAQSRNPVNVMLGYTILPNGTRQLTIDQLLHFQWHQNTMSDKGQPLQFSP